MSADACSENLTSTTVFRTLTSLTEDGKLYERSASVQAEIQKMLSLAESERMAAAADLQSETLVYLFRQVRRADEQIMGRRLQELARRIIRDTRKWTRGLDPTIAEDIALQVGLQIMELLLAETPSRQSEFLEVAFGPAVQSLTINAIVKHHRYK